ncbi:MAG: VWA domain-containing protein [Ignavibacteriales bacterium]|nr:VWA domain-containing protein [Ignavibacteriales bacterium]MCF8306320.1 VWA domain-containing protein [Ignavibacteriales bacterium]MCF8316041.1 VWA domain-containing protein [Ignavibacteriales bacterium]MCF8437635.1 VWA domain-containing protein [Ignavibacteriales bacterium]
MENRGKPVRPGGEISKRFLDLMVLADKSASMNENGKMASLNTAMREALPYIKSVQNENPGACIRLSIMSFSHGAEWQQAEPVPVESYIWKDITADANPQNHNSGNLEIVFLIDTSGSMSDEITSVKRSCVDFATAIQKQGLEVRLGLVGFDIGGYRGAKSSKFEVTKLSTYTIGRWPLMSPEQFKDNINELTVGLFGGAGCYLANTDTIDIFPHVVDTFGKSNANRVLVIISDEIGNDSGLEAILRTLKAAKVKTYVLGVSHGNAHKQLARQTGGEFWDIVENKGKKDFSSLLVNSVAETIGREAKKTLSDGRVSMGTDMGAAIGLLTKRIKVEAMPNRCLPPVTILVSDGQPTDDYYGALGQFTEEPWARKMVRLAIAVGEDCDTKILQDFIGNKEIKPLVASNSGQLIRYFKWASTVVLRNVSSPVRTGVNVPRYIDVVPEPINNTASKF